MKTVLIFSRYFPPLYAIGGKRAYRFARYLPRYGWRPVVVTAPIPANRPLDPTAGLPMDERALIVRRYYPDLSKIEAMAAKLLPKGAGGGSDGTVAAPLREPTFPPKNPLAWLRWQLTVPVASDIFNLPRWRHVAKKLAAEHQADAIFATSSPYSALVLGAAAKKATGLPTILDLRDPWSLNFVQHKKPPWVRKVDRWVEQRVLRQADHITFTCESVIEAYRERYAWMREAPMSCIYNAFDPEHAPPAVAPATSGPLTIVHFGNVYGGRSLAPLVHAVAELARRGVTPAELQVRNLGRMAEGDLTLMAELGVEAFFRFEPFVPYAQGLEILAAADLQLLLAYGDETLFLPAKLYDYLLTGRPILCYSRPSELTRILAETRAGASFTPEDVAGTVAYLEDALEARRAHRPLAVPDPEVVDRFSAPRTAERLAALLDELVAKKARA